ncbi:MAG: hypothetical protein MUF73_08325 [Rhodobacteraceae bacterium]|jgi:hypothetical protein|nr:hypothetical protein [Paracoccaceae bacterium]
MRRLILVAVLWLAACGTALLPGDSPTPRAAAPAATPGELQRIACERRGGRLTPGPGRGSLICAVTPRDAGQTCARSTDCSGECLARSRTCAPVVPLRGCHDVLDSSGRSTRLCLQ